MDEIEALVRDAIAPFGVRIEILVEELAVLKAKVDNLDTIVHLLRKEASHGNEVPDTSLPTWDGPDSP